MNKTVIIILLLASSLLCGCKKWIELTETTIKSVTINDVTYEYKDTYRPIMGSNKILPFEFNGLDDVGRYQLFLPDVDIVITFIIKCQYEDFAPPKKFILRNPLISTDQTYTLVDMMWSPEIVNYIPEGSDGIAFMYGWGKYSRRNPIGLSGYLELLETTVGYNRNKFELSSDSIQPIIITDGFFYTSKM